MELLQKIISTIEPSVAALGYGLVQVKLAEGSRRRALIIMAERADGTPMGFDDCTEISHTVSALMDVEDPIVGAYDLEVMSPGPDRPLTKPEDYKRFAGQEAKIETMISLEGRKRFRGVIKEMAKDAVTLAMPEGTVDIPFRQIRTAKLTGLKAEGLGLKGKNPKPKAHSPKPKK